MGMSTWSIVCYLSRTCSKATSTVSTQTFLPMRSSSRPEYCPTLGALTSLSLEELRKSSMFKGWQRTCCRQLRCDFLTSAWSMLPRLQLPALPPQAMAAASSQAMLPSTSAICPPPRPLPTPHRLASRITFLAGSGNTSPSLQFPHVPSHSAEALCEALRSQGLCLTHAETASLLAALAKRSFRATLVITTLRTQCPQCGSPPQQAKVASRRSPSDSNNA